MSGKEQAEASDSSSRTSTSTSFVSQPNIPSVEMIFFLVRMGLSVCGCGCGCDCVSGCGFCCG